MRPDKILVFDLKGDYAQFRKFFTNMSPLSFSIPPRTVLTGIIGALIGSDKETNPECFTKDNSFVALRLMGPVSKARIAHNYLKVTSDKHFYRFEQHKPTNVEFLKNVHYRVYFNHTDENIYGTLKQNLMEHKTYYSISLGISGCLADFVYLGEFIPESISIDDYIIFDSVLPTASINRLDLSGQLRLQKVVLPSVMKNDREVIAYDEVIYDMDGKTLRAKITDEAYKIGTGETVHGF